MNKMVLKRVGVFSVAKMGGIVGIMVGLVIGVIYGLLLMAFGAMFMSGTSDYRGSSDVGAGAFVGGLMAMIITPIAYAIVSFIVGAIYAFVYNLAAKFAGGIEMEFESGVQQYGAPQYGPPPPPPPQQQWGPNRY
jgi:hypothetical protein